MSLSPGTRIGIHEITGPLGAGGMGEVYRATDTNLGRQVAIKILPPEFAADPERVARFEREARTLASLNHPHIAQVYGLEKSSGSLALVMELVEGEDLSQRIAKGPIPPDEALPIARQIAEALEAAHEAGIIHRDLKPANIKVRADGTVKVLDFGLAKAVEQGSGIRDQGSGGGETSPTITTPAMTLRGVILGTAAYMSPEQAKGKPVDRRTDIWAFGCVLYEMLAGQRAFKGDDVTDTITSVLRDEPPWERLPAETGPAVQRVLRVCLEKDTRRRLRDIGDVRVWLDGADLTHAAAPLPSRASQWRPAAIAGAAVVAAAAIGVLAGMRAVPPPERRVLTVELGLPPDAPANQIALTPDSSRVIFVGGSGTRLMVRSLDALESVELARGSNISAPFVSPDGRWVGYVDESSRMFKVPVSGGRPSRIATFDGRLWGATWLDEGTIIAATPTSTGLLRVSADGGAAPIPITTPEPGFDHLWPERLPDGHSILFGVTPRNEALGNRVARLQRLDLSTAVISTVMEGGGTYARAVASGHLAYLDDARVMVVPFNLDAFVVAPDAVPADTGVRATFFALSDDGTLAYAEPDANVAGGRRSLVWVDGDGTETDIPAEPRSYQYPQASPDGRRVAVAVLGAPADIWLLDVATSAMTRLTFEPSTETAPVWTPDGARIVFASNRDNGIFNLWWQPADGTGRAERLTDGQSAKFPTTITPDGRHAIFWENSAEAGRDLKMVALDGTKRVTPLLETPEAELFAALSPDGRWLAFESDRSGQRDVFVRPFPDVDRGLWQVSSGGGRQPLWSRDGSELFFFGPDGAVMSARVSAQSDAFRAAPPQRVLEPKYYGVRTPALVARSYDAMPGSRRFIAIKAPQEQDTPGRPDIVLIQSWSATLAPRAR